MGEMLAPLRYITKFLSRCGFNKEAKNKVPPVFIWTNAKVSPLTVAEQFLSSLLQAGDRASLLGLIYDYATEASLRAVQRGHPYRKVAWQEFRKCRSPVDTTCACTTLQCWSARL